MLLEDNYQPDEWLEPFVGMPPYHRLYTDDLMTVNMPVLIKDIGKRGVAVMDANRDQNEGIW